MINDFVSQNILLYDLYTFACVRTIFHGKLFIPLEIFLKYSFWTHLQLFLPTKIRDVQLIYVLRVQIIGYYIRKIRRRLLVFLISVFWINRRLFVSKNFEREQLLLDLAHFETNIQSTVVFFPAHRFTFCYLLQSYIHILCSTDKRFWRKLELKMSNFRLETKYCI